MILEQGDIFDRMVNKKTLEIRPWEQERLQPASYELALSSRFLLFDPTVEVIDPLDLGDYTTEVNIDDNEGKYYDQGYLVLHPGEFVLGSSVEVFRFPNDLCGHLGGKSSLGRLGLQVHATAGFFEPGFYGTATLELSNVCRLPIRLWPGMLVAQMFFEKLSRVSEKPYGSPGLHSRYQGQSGPTASRFSEKRPTARIRELGGFSGDPEQLRLPGVQWEDYEESGKP
jgi:dCTP deaminase